MKAVRQIIAHLNRFLVEREAESVAKKAKHRTRDAILELLPPNTSNEWEIVAWGRITYKTPQDSLSVDMEKLERDFPKAYKACVSPRPNEPRFCVYPTKEVLMAAFQETVVMKGSGIEVLQKEAQ